MTNLVRRLAAFAALFAVLLGAVAPTVTHLLAAERGVPAFLSEICTATGTRPSKKPTPIQSHDGCCPFCLGHAGALALPPSDFLWRFVVIGSFAAAAEPDISRVRGAIWLAAQPRGPPIFS